MNAGRGPRPPPGGGGGRRRPRGPPSHPWAMSHEPWGMHQAEWIFLYILVYSKKRIFFKTGSLKTGSGASRPLVSPKFARVTQEGGRVQGWESYKSQSSKHNMFEKWFEIFGVSRCLQIWIIFILGIMLTSTSPRTIQMRGFVSFPKWIRKVTSPKWSRIILQSLLATLSILLTIKMTKKTRKIKRCGLSQVFPGFSIGNTAHMHV